MPLLQPVAEPEPITTQEGERGEGMLTDSLNTNIKVIFSDGIYTDRYVYPNSDEETPLRKEPGPIYQAARSCRTSLLRCRFLSRKTRARSEWTDWIEKRCVEFNMWCATSRVFELGRSCMDERLHLREGDRQVLGSFLGLVDFVLQDIHEYLAVEQTPPTRAKGRSKKKRKQEPPESHKAIDGDKCKRDLRDMLVELNELTQSMEESMPHSGLWQANFQSSRQESGQDEEEITQQKPIKIQIGESDGAIWDDIPRRLGKANEKRLQRMGYGKAVGNQSDPEGSKQLPSESPLLVWPLQAPKDEQPVHSPPPDIPDIPDIIVEAETSEQPEQDPWYPRLRPISPSASEFSCPCCSIVLPSYFTHPRAWRQHVAADFVPYTCVLPGCPTPLDMYATQEEWKHHMIHTQHFGSKMPRRYWVCPACPNGRFQECDDLWFWQHIQDWHSDVDPEDIRDFLPVTIIAFEACPCCQVSFSNLSSDILEDHIAKCVRALSLEAIKPFLRDKIFQPPRTTIVRKTPEKPVQAPTLTKDSSGLLDVPDIPRHLFEYDRWQLAWEQLGIKDIRDTFVWDGAPDEEALAEGVSLPTTPWDNVSFIVGKEEVSPPPPLHPAALPTAESLQEQTDEARTPTASPVPSLLFSVSSDATWFSDAVPAQTDTQALSPTQAAFPRPGLGRRRRRPSSPVTVIRPDSISVSSHSSESNDAVGAQGAGDSWLQTWTQDQMREFVPSLLGPVARCFDGLQRMQNKIEGFEARFHGHDNGNHG